MEAFLERWRDIEGYEGLYQVSDFGEVRSLGMWKNGKGGSTYFQEGRILKIGKHTDGDLQVGLYKDGKVKKHYIHRLVAQAFIDNPDNLPEINHKDEDKANNVVSNLEWCDRKYNNTYGTLQERKAKAQSKKPIQLTLDYNFVKEWSSLRECERNGFNQGAVSLCCNNKYGLQKNVYKGYRWVKAEDYYKLFA